MQLRLNKNNKTKVILLILFLALLGAGSFALDRANIINLPFLPDKNNDSNSTGINYGPPTEEEKKETEEFKKDQTNNPQTAPAPQNSSGQKKSVNVYITSWGYNKISGNAEITGYVAGVVESGGTCTLTLKKGSTEVKESRNATADAQSTSCGLISISRNRLSAGAWAATLSYSSNVSSGTSQSTNIDVE